MATSYYKLYKTDTDNEYFWLKNETGAYSTIYIHWWGSSQPSISYSKDKTNWETISSYTTYIDMKPYEKVFIRSSNGFSLSDSSFYVISSDGFFSAGGKISSLIDYTDMENVTTLPDYCFQRMFDESAIDNSGSSRGKYLTTNLCDISEIDFGNIVNIGERSMYFMFNGNKYITKIPDFSKIETIGNYGMNRCFYNNFNNRSGAVFSSLTTIGTYGMSECFSSNTYMERNPDFSNLTSVGEQGLNRCLYDCQYITEGADFSSLATIGNYGMQNLYYGCYRLNDVTAPNVQEWDTSKFNGWMYDAGVLASGTKTFNAPTGLTIPTDDTSGIPTGWTRVDY